MRRHQPRLVDPMRAVRRVTEEALAVPTPGDLQAEIQRARRERAQASEASAPIVSGSWSDGSAGQSLARALAELGLIIDQTSA